LTFAALTQNPVGTTLFDPESNTAMTHTELGMKARAFVVAPATANLVGTIAHGLANDLLTTTLLVATCPTLICPAMNTNMWDNRQVQKNIATLEENPRYHVMSPGEGQLACGAIGAGRLPEPQSILERLQSIVRNSVDDSLRGKKVLISGGPTREYLDPVRFLSNPATGTLSVNMARIARDRGAEVTLVLGPTDISPPAGVACIRVTSAEEMAKTILEQAPTSDLLCMAAAVADWRPETAHKTKQHKTDSAQDIKLVRTRDILKSVQKLGGPRPRVLGFAAETEGDLEALVALGREKMTRKGCDLLFVNPVYGEIYGFGGGQTSGVLLGPNDSRLDVGTLPKEELADLLMRAASDLLETPAESVEEIA